MTFPLFGHFVFLRQPLFSVLAVAFLPAFPYNGLKTQKKGAMSMPEQERDALAQELHKQALGNPERKCLMPAGEPGRKERCC